MYRQDELKQLLFIDIETAASHSDYQEFAHSLSANSQMATWWSEKCMFIRKDRPELETKSDEEIYNIQSALFPEWGRIVCISMGQIKFNEEGRASDFKARSFYGDNEKELLKEFLQVLTAIFFKAPGVKLVGHNIKGFDVPYICKRAMIHGIELPKQLHMQKVKPWDSCLLDTADVWKFGGWNGAKLGVICEVLGIPSPKEQMEGGQVSAEFYKGNIQQIMEYCERDIKATADVMLKLSGMTILP